MSHRSPCSFGENMKKNNMKMKVKKIQILWRKINLKMNAERYWRDVRWWKILKICWKIRKFGDLNEFHCGRRTRAVLEKTVSQIEEKLILSMDSLSPLAARCPNSLLSSFSPLLCVLKAWGGRKARVESGKEKMVGGCHRESQQASSAWYRRATDRKDRQTGRKKTRMPRPACQRDGSL